MAGIIGPGSCAVPMATSQEQWTVMDLLYLGRLRPGTGQKTVNASADSLSVHFLFDSRLYLMPLFAETVYNGCGCLDGF